MWLKLSLLGYWVTKTSILNSSALFKSSCSCQWTLEHTIHYSQYIFSLLEQGLYSYNTQLFKAHMFKKSRTNTDPYSRLKRACEMTQWRVSVNLTEWHHSSQQLHTSVWVPDTNRAHKGKHTALKQHRSSCCHKRSHDSITRSRKDSCNVTMNKWVTFGLRDNCAGAHMLRHVVIIQSRKKYKGHMYN